MKGVGLAWISLLIVSSFIMILMNPFFLMIQGGVFLLLMVFPLNFFNLVLKVPFLNINEIRGIKLSFEGYLLNLMSLLVRLKTRSIILYKFSNQYGKWGNAFGFKWVIKPLLALICHRDNKTNLWENLDVPLYHVDLWGMLDEFGNMISCWRWITIELW